MCLIPKAEAFHDLALPAAQPGQELWRWLYTSLRAAILDGRLRPGSRLPSTRSLAKQYGLSRGTVVAAFAQLRSEGYTDARVSAGTYVASGLGNLARTYRKERVILPELHFAAQLANHAKQAVRGIEVVPSSDRVGKAFRAYEPAIDVFPINLWARVASRVLRRAPRSIYGHGSAGGYVPLRRAVAAYLGSARGIRCAPEQIIITAGAQQALDLLGRFMIDAGDQVWIEDPAYTGALHAFRAAGAAVIPVPVDAEGIDVRAGRKLAPRAKLAYVTPGNQFPLGVTMSADRRIDLLAWARESGALIIEDEYDAEYRYFGRPVASLRSLDTTDSVIYVGTFTKMLFNALRIGFMVLPQSLISAFEAGRSFVDRHTPTLDQAILAEFITEGHFAHHVHKMRKLYAERKTLLEEMCTQYAQGLIEVAPTDTGMRTIGWLSGRQSDRVVAASARTAGLEVIALSTFSIRKALAPGLVLGFAGCDSDELRRGASVLAKAIIDARFAAGSPEGWSREEQR